MTKRHGYALLSAIIALIVGLSAAIYVGFASDNDVSCAAAGSGATSSAAENSAPTMMRKLLLRACR